MSSPDPAHVLTALRLWLADPAGLGGLCLRARPGPVRDHVLARIDTALRPLPVVHPDTGDEALFGGLDVAATLAAGRPVTREGLLAKGRPVRLAMAERAAPGLAGRLACWLDGPDAAGLLALDEGASEDETMPPALADRLAFALTLDGLRMADLDAARPLDPRGDPVSAEAAMTALAAASETLGICGLRAPILAMRAAQASARVAGRKDILTGDVTLAAALVLAPRATRLPADSEDQPETAPPPEATDGEDGGQTGADDLPTEMVIEAIRAALPADLLARAQANAARGARGAGAGARRLGNRKGRPKPPRPGRLSSGARVDVVATLRAAAPWQRLRADTPAGPSRLRLRPSDLRLKRFETRSDRLLVFVVDASGSAALGRLAEVKGAVETLLSEAYARRDQVALISFRGTGAEVMLPPTRSLVQAKRRLAGLPGGGATPLAAGLDAARDVADRARRAGLSPLICLLTDGRANMALDGTPGRAEAGADARRIARVLRAEGHDALILDAGRRPDGALAELAAEMSARYVPMPFATADRLSGTISAALARE